MEMEMSSSKPLPDQSTMMFKLSSEGALLPVIQGNQWIFQVALGSNQADLHA